jgi:hypothetical protein
MRGNRADGRNENRPAELIVIYWRDIPAQVTARQGRSKVSVQLSDRFQIAIDKAAARAGKHTTDDYLEEWRRESTPCDGDLQHNVETVSTSLESGYDDARLERLVRSGGLESGPETPAHGAGAAGRADAPDSVEAGQGGPD